MRASIILVHVAAIATTSTATASQKVISLNFSRAGPRYHPLDKRGGIFSQELNNNLTGGGYYAEVALGTPPQNVTLILDTGSSDVWVLDSSADLCQSRNLQSVYGGCLATYDPSESSTYSLVQKDAFSIQYLDRSGAGGHYIKDTFHVAGTSIRALQVGLAENSTINSGLLGIGFSANVAAAEPYRNIIDLFADQGLIDTRAYSLYLDDLYADTGTILFGGIDTDKFIGQLKAIDIYPDAGTRNYSSFTVALSSLTLSGHASDDQDYLRNAIPALLDSGTTLTYLPQSVAAQIYETLQAVDDTEGTGLVYVSCDLLSDEKDTTFDFRFGGPDGPLIRVPMDEMVLDNIRGYVDIGLQLPNLSFDEVCSFGIHPLSGLYLLGDTFLRSAYVVYDLSNKKIALAQAHLNATGSNVLEITQSAGIPLVRGVESQMSGTSTTTDPPGAGGDSNPTDAPDGPAPSVTGSQTPSESTPDNAVARVSPIPGWGPTFLPLVAAFWVVAGATLFILE